jgi:dTDP-4-dehydrorhamnose 3,5-epimerase
MTEIIESATIPGVKLVQFRVLADDRGRFMETFRSAWFPERKWEIIQNNRSISKPGVLRGLHYHHRQVDYWQLMAGKIRVGLADLRRSSASFGTSEIIELDAESPSGLFIPVGVAHGFYAMTDCTLLYIVDNYYDGSDELGVAWNDPHLRVDWGVTTPLLSERDRKNPNLADIPQDQLPA